MQVRKIDPKKMSAYDRYVKSKKMDKDSIRMAHDNPNNPMSKRMMKSKAFAKAVNMYKSAGMKESFQIPEDIPFKERNAFMGAAASAAKAGKSHFNFGGKKHPVTMDKKVATKITDDADAMKAFLAKGGKITKLPPGKAQGYHGKDDPGKGMHGMMAKGDTKAMGTRKKVKSMGEEVVDEALNKDDKPFVKKLIGNLRKGSKTHGKQADDLEKAMNSEAKRTVHSDKEDRLVTLKIKNPAPKKKAGETATMNPKLGTTEKGKSEMEQKESTIRKKLLAVLESDRASHYKSATEPEEMDSKMSPGGKKMKADIQGNTTDVDMLKKAFDDVSKAGKAGPAMKPRTNDKKDGDKKMMTPPEDVTKKAGMKEETRDQLAGIKAAYASMYAEENEDIKEKLTPDQRVARDAGRGKGKAATGYVKARMKAAEPGEGPTDNELKNRMHKGAPGDSLGKIKHDTSARPKDKLASQPDIKTRLKNKKSMDAYHKARRQSQSPSGRSNMGGVGIRY